MICFKSLNINTTFWCAKLIHLLHFVKSKLILFLDIVLTVSHLEIILDQMLLVYRSAFISWADIKYFFYFHFVW